jgi:uncharacterized membrane protein
MNALTEPSDRQGAPSTPHSGLVCLGIIGLAATAAAWWAVQPLQFNIVTYEVVRQPTAHFVPTFIFGMIVFLFPIACAFTASSRAAGRRISTSLSLLWPLVGNVPLGLFAFWPDRQPPFAFTFLSVLSGGATVFLAGLRGSVACSPRPRLAVAILISLIGLLTLIHTRIEINFFEHFMFGHADVGHFTEELKNVLAGRGLRSDSFDNTRLGWHFVPLQFVLVPGYILWPSPKYLMALGPLVLHLGALPAFWFARRRSGSVLVAFLIGLAWLFLPSLSRLVYSNTYGFAWLYCSVPLLGVLLSAALLERWRLCWILVAVLLLCRETNSAVTLGFGCYLALFSPRRKAGVLICLISIAYALLCAKVLIPYFATAGRYERLDMFGELGNSVGTLATSPFTNPALFFSRLVRPQSVSFLLVVLTSMFFLPSVGWRLGLAALPTLIVHLLLAGTDWLSIKFWHHAMILPFFFFASITALRLGSADPSRNRAVALALLVCAAASHYFYGFSPISKSFELNANDAFLQNPDPRLPFIERLREQIPRDRTILATERVAAHFTDYRRLYTGRRVRPADFVVIDRSDQWDPSSLPRSWTAFGSDPDYRFYAEFESIIVFERRPEAPPAVPD